MTEDAYVTCTDPVRLLPFLRASGKLSERKARLFGCACCRRIWRLLTEEGSRDSVQAAEKFADGLLTGEHLAAAFRNAQDAQEMLHRAKWNMEAKADFQFTYEYQLVQAQHLASIVALQTAAPFAGRDWSDDFLADAVQSATEAAALAPDLFDLQIGLKAYMTARADEDNWCKTVTERVRDAREAADDATHSATRNAENVQQDRLLHDLFGPLPFREVRIDQGWLAWGDNTVRKLAEAIYDQRIMPEGRLDQSRLKILADALEEAGCDNEEILSHCRSPNVHVRGCWVVDVLLGKS